MIVLNYEGTKTENEIYQIVLKNTDELIVAIGDNAELLANLVTELKNRLALAENRYYSAKQKIEFEQPGKKNLFNVASQERHIGVIVTSSLPVTL